MLIPATVKFVEKKTGLELDLFNLDEGIAFVVSKFIEYFMLNAGLKATVYRENQVHILMKFRSIYCHFLNLMLWTVIVLENPLTLFHYGN